MKRKNVLFLMFLFGTAELDCMDSFADPYSRSGFGPALIFSDGFETGDTANWSLAVGELGCQNVQGNLWAYADYISLGGDVPAGRTGLPRLRVCAYEIILGDNDLQAHGSIVNDNLLGCASADVNGFYNIATGLPGGSVCPDFYLATWFCDGEDSGSPSNAEVCIRLNAREVDASDPQNRKYLWSRTYDDLPPGPAVMSVNWHLSCPNKDGFPNLTIPCSAAEADLQAGASGDQNSTFGYTKEFLHAFRASSEALVKLGSLKTNLANTLDFTCTAGGCLDEINLHVHDAQPAGQDPFTASCEGISGQNNFSIGYSGVCLTTPENPFRVVHELAHNVHRRWLVHSSSLAGGLDCVGWNSNEDQKCATSEGWSNFLSSATWYGPNHPSPTYDGLPIEPLDSLQSCAAAPFSEGHFSQFLWDLYDTRQDSLELDDVALPFDLLRSVWSLFPPGTLNHQNNESGPNGRNGRDWYYWYEREFGDPGMRVWSLMEQNCIDLYAD